MCETDVVRGDKEGVTLLVITIYPKIGHLYPLWQTENAARGSNFSISNGRPLPPTDGLTDWLPGVDCSGYNCSGYNPLTLLARF